MVTYHWVFKYFSLFLFALIWTPLRTHSFVQQIQVNLHGKSTSGLSKSRSHPSYTQSKGQVLRSCDIYNRRHVFQIPLPLRMSSQETHNHRQTHPSAPSFAHNKDHRRDMRLDMSQNNNGQDRKTFKRFWEKELYRQPELASLYDILCGVEVACRDINRLMRRISTDNLSGLAGGAINIQGEEQKKLDVVANRIMKNALCCSGELSIVASEEEDDPQLCSVVTDNRAFVGDYAAVFDPLDGSSNVDSGLPTGTIFGIYKNPPFGANDPFTVVKQKGSNLVVSGYCLYSAATHLVLTMNTGLHQFTLDDVTGEFYLTKENVQIPVTGPIYAANDANKDDWHHSIQNFMDDFKNNRLNTKDFTKLAKPIKKYAYLSEEGDGGSSSTGAGDDKKAKKVKASARYFGALVADAHNVLTNGGLYAYPGTTKAPHGKIRLLYEANPMAMIFEQAGGLASNGNKRILDLSVTDIHIRTPIYIGSKETISTLERYVAFYGNE